MDNAKYNENYYNTMTKEMKDKWINIVYEHYNKQLPFVKHDINKIKDNIKLLQHNQKYNVIITNFNYSKYNLNSLIYFIKNNKIDKKNNDKYIM